MSVKENQTITVCGNSMEPTLSCGQRLSISLDEPVQQGDICLIRDNQAQELIVHRLVSKNPLVFKGDNSLNIEEGEDFSLIGVSLTERKRVNHLLARLSLNYCFQVPRLIRVPSKLLLRLIVCLF